MELLFGNSFPFSNLRTDIGDGVNLLTIDKLPQESTSDPDYFFYIHGDRLILHISANGQKVATKSLGALADIIGAGSGSLRHTGITPAWNIFMLAPYLLLFFTLFLIASFRPMRRIPIWACRAPPYSQLINLWSSYTRSLHEAVHLFHHRSALKFVSLVLAFICLTQFPLQAMAGPEGT